MNEIMNRLANLILNEIEKRKCTYSCFADMCGVSLNEIYCLVNKKYSDMRLSTLIKICNNSGIFIADVLGYCSVLDAQENIVDNTIITIRGVEYKLTKSNSPNSEK